MSDVKILQQEVVAISDKLGHSKDPNIILLFLLEELGETARAFLKEQGHKEDNDRVSETVQQELGDVFLLILRLAHVTGVDLEKGLNNTIKKLQTTTTT